MLPKSCASTLKTTLSLWFLVLSIFTLSSCAGLSNKAFKKNTPSTSTGIEKRQQNASIVSRNQCVDPDGNIVNAIELDLSCNKALFELAESLIQQDDFRRAEKILIALRNRGDVAADILLAAYSTDRKMSFYDTVSAISKLRAYQEAGNGYAAQMMAITWLVNEPGFPGPSKVNAYLAARQALRVGAKSGFIKLLSELLPNFSQKSRLVLQKLNVRFSYRETTDPMTDKRFCGILSYKNKGINFGVDMSGIYLEGSEPLLARQYNYMGIRVDKSEFFRAQIPSALKELHEFTSNISMLFIHRGISSTEASRLFKAGRFENPKKLYVAYAGTDRFDRLIAQLALGDIATVRAVTENRKVTVALFDLKVDLGKAAKNAALLDLYGYIYLNCKYGALGRVNN